MARLLDLTEYPNYPAIKQDEFDGCVYASIAAAVNHLAQTTWTEKSFRQNSTKFPASFDVAKAIPPELELEKFHKHHDFAADSDDYISDIRKDINNGMIMVVSFRIPSTLGIEDPYHMMTLVERGIESGWKAWDTAGCWLLLTEADLRRGFIHPSCGTQYKPHDLADRLVLRRA